MLREIKEADTSQSELYQKQIEFMYEKAVQSLTSAEMEERQKEKLRLEFN